MELERITEDNIEYAVVIQNEIFPEENARQNYEESVKGISGFEYYLVYENGDCVGVTGIYSYPDDHDNAWLGWFGIREPYRRKHYGSEVLRMFEDMALRKGYRYTRLYTEAENNGAAIAFYTANGYTSEPYDNPDDAASREIRLLIFSKSLVNGPVDPWNSRNIHLSEQIVKQSQREE